VTDTVLYIDDDALNLRLVERMLVRRPALSLITATNARDGLDLARTAGPRLILLDRRLPDMLGTEVLRQLKESDRTASIPVVVISGDSGGQYADELRTLGAAEFLAKPYDLQQLMTLIDRFCG
jgi:CheY-like chemotaxis protein